MFVGVSLQKYLNPLLLKQPQPTLGVGCHPRELVGRVGTLDALAFFANPEKKLLIFFFLIFLIFPFYLVGTGGSYFFFSPFPSLSFPSPPPAPDC